MSSSIKPPPKISSSFKFTKLLEDMEMRMSFDCPSSEDQIEDFTPTEDHDFVQCTTYQSYVETQCSQISEIDNEQIDNKEIHNECVLDYSSEFTTFEIFKSKGALIQWARDRGRRNGLVIVTLTSDNGQNGRAPRLTLGCERSGYYRDRRKNKAKPVEPKGRLTGTKKCGCPFSLKGQKLENDDDWILQVICGLHNHPAAQTLEGHSFTGRLSNEENSLLIDLSKSLVKPKQILVTLKQKDEQNTSTMRTIYNARQRFKVKEKAGRSQMQQLLAQLSHNKYVEWHRSDEQTDTILDLFWAHPVSLELLRTFPHVLIMDCTYKTNRYRMPLLEIVGVTPTEMTFSVATIYLQCERTDNYSWALNILRSVMDENSLPSVIVTDRELALMKAISIVFPTCRHLLCRWHISKNIAVNCKKMFEGNEKWEKFLLSWNLVVYSSTKEEYVDHFATLAKEFHTYPAAIKYVLDSWLDPFKEKFVSAWTDTCMHFGNVTTNRVESAHAQLKRQLGSSQGSFENCWDSIHRLLQIQHTEIKASFEKSITIVQHSFTPKEFKELRGNISKNALERILAESKRAQDVGMDISSCGCSVRHTHGLPCAHEIAEYMVQCRPIPLASVHPYWSTLSIGQASKEKTTTLNPDTILQMISKQFKDCDDTMKAQVIKKLTEIVNPGSTFIIEPEIKPPKKRGHMKLDTSTRREPSAFELIQSQHDSHSPRVSQSSKDSIKSKQMKCKKLKSSNLNPSIPFLSEFPDALQPYIRSITNVPSDGNCGFWAVGGLLNMGDHAAVQVRKDLIEELYSNLDYYSRMWDEDRIQDLTEILSYLEPYPGHAHWMTMPDMGPLIASKYGVTLFHLSKNQCITFLPHRTRPNKKNPTEIGLGFVNNNHFVQVYLLPGHPVPPITPNWTTFRLDDAKEWEGIYTKRIQRWREVVSSKIITTDVIEL